MTRRELREHIFKLLFALEFCGQDDWEEQVDLYFQQLPDEEIVSPPMFANDEERAYIREKAMQTAKRFRELDERIDEVSRGWRTGRMSRTDLTILRLALYEMDYDDEIPVGVAINEAVELAKQYGNDASKAFVNGILAKLTKSRDVKEGSGEAE